MFIHLKDLNISSTLIAFDNAVVETSFRTAIITKLCKINHNILITVTFINAKLTRT